MKRKNSPLTNEIDMLCLIITSIIAIPFTQSIHFIRSLLKLIDISPNYYIHPQ